MECMECFVRHLGYRNFVIKIINNNTNCIYINTIRI